MGRVKKPKFTDKNGKSIKVGATIELRYELEGVDEPMSVTGEVKFEEGLYYINAMDLDITVTEEDDFLIKE